MTAKALTIPDTTIGKKVVMAVSGLVLFGFVIGHMLGNLQVYLGSKAFNEYAKLLHDMPALLWGTRFALLLAVVAHVASALQLTARNKKARPTGYKMQKSRTTSAAAKSMTYGGIAIVLYVIYHLAHFTFGVTKGLGYDHLPMDANGLPDVYFNVVTSFQVPWCAALYVVANVVLGFHLYHGAWSLFQTLGLNHRRYNETLRSAASAIAIATVAGFMAVPIGVVLGFVHL
jgi:succinate dehydrogenase / fumarate reductase cytochrome b subunit